MATEATKKENGSQLNAEKNQSFSKVLLVDDDHVFLNISKEILEMDERFKIETATSIDEAFKKLNQTHYDVVVSDYEMPRKNGLQFLEELKKSASNLPFILFTGKGREEVAAKALNLGAFRYLNKHGDPETVYTELSSCIQQAADHTKAQNLIRESEERFHTLFEASSDAIIVIDDEGIITDLNEAASQMFKCTKDMIGQGFFERFNGKFPKASKQMVLEGIKKFAADNKGKTAGKTIQLSLQQGTDAEKTIEVHASVFKQNSRLYSLAIIRDITEHIRNQNEKKTKN